MSKRCRPAIRSAVCCLVVALQVGPATAAFMRLGPFDFTAGASLSTIYTTNVDGNRPSQQTLEPKDLYFVYGFSISADGRLGPETTLSLGFSSDWERHMNRPDLDTDPKPLGLGDISFDLVTGRPPMRLRTFASYTRSTETRDTAFVGGTRSRWDENTLAVYGVEGVFAMNRLRMDAGFNASEERHVREEFQDGDEDKENLFFNASYSLFPRVRAVYEFDRERTDLLNTQDEFTGWEDTYGIGLDVDILRRPRLVYGFRYERDDLRGEVGEWEATHTLTLAEDVSVPVAETPTFTFNLFASYSFEKENENPDDVAFQYGLSMIHQINPLMTQSLTGKREPLDLFGSTATTAVTEWAYVLTRRAFIFPTAAASLRLGYTLSEPEDGTSPDEELYDMVLGIASSRPITPWLNRSFGYAYLLEDSSLESELLEEHRVTLTLSVRW